ncbi:hypothetical protein Tco_1311977 [Tanacetum coccineum]
MYIRPCLYEAIIVVMTARSDDGMKVSRGILRDGTCDQFSITSLPLLLPYPGCFPRVDVCASMDVKARL